MAVTSKIPQEIKTLMDDVFKHIKEIHSQFTAIKGFSDQQLKFCANLESAFMTVVGKVNRIEAYLGLNKLEGSAATAPTSSKGFSLENCGLAQRITNKMRMEKLPNGKRVIYTDWLGDDWEIANKLFRQHGFKWIKDGKKSRWEEQ